MFFYRPVSGTSFPLSADAYRAARHNIHTSVSSTSAAAKETPKNVASARSDSRCSSFMIAPHDVIVFIFPTN